MFGSKTKPQSSHYPFLSFHCIRASSLLSSLVVSAILLYFTYHLKHDNYKIPWTFLVLLGVSLFTIVALAFTFLLHLCHVLSPRLNLYFINIPLFTVWCLGLGLLGWNMSGTLGHACNKDNWGSSAGVLVCRLYKALFSFTVIAWISSLASVILDLSTWRKQVRRGVYKEMGNGTSDVKLGGLGGMVNHATPQKQATPTISVEPYPNEGHEPTTNYYGRYNDKRDAVGVDHFGYGAPTEQTRYDAGSYSDRR